MSRKAIYPVRVLILEVHLLWHSIISPRDEYEVMKPIGQAVQKLLWSLVNKTNSYAGTEHLIIFNLRLISIKACYFTAIKDFSNKSRIFLLQIPTLKVYKKPLNRLDISRKPFVVSVYFNLMCLLKTMEPISRNFLKIFSNIGNCRKNSNKSNKFVDFFMLELRNKCFYGIFFEHYEQLVRVFTALKNIYGIRVKCLFSECK